MHQAVSCLAERPALFPGRFEEPMARLIAILLDVDGEGRFGLLGDRIIEILPPLGGSRWLEAVVKSGLSDGLRSSDPRIRSRCTLALGKISPPAPEVVEALRYGLNDEDPDVRQSAAWALEGLGEPSAGLESGIAAPAGTVSEPGPSLEPAAGSSKDRIAKLLEQMGDYSPGVVAEAAQALGALAMDERHVDAAERREICDRLAALLREKACPRTSEDAVFEVFARLVDYDNEMQAEDHDAAVDRA